MHGLLALFASEILHSEDAAQYDNADDVGQDGRINEAETARQKEKTLQDIRLAIELADHGRRVAAPTAPRGNGGFRAREE